MHIYPYLLPYKDPDDIPKEMLSRKLKIPINKINALIGQLKTNEKIFINLLIMDFLEGEIPNWVKRPKNLNNIKRKIYQEKNIIIKKIEPKKNQKKELDKRECEDHDNIYQQIADTIPTLDFSKIKQKNTSEQVNLIWLNNSTRYTQMRARGYPQEEQKPETTEEILSKLSKFISPYLDPVSNYLYNMQDKKFITQYNKLNDNEKRKYANAMYTFIRSYTQNEIMKQNNEMLAVFQTMQFLQSLN